MMKGSLLLIFLVGAWPTVSAQTDPYAHTWTVLAGLGQPIVGHGVNIASTYFSRKITFEYSHGMFLSYKGTWNTDKNIRSVYVLYSTGLGVGYRLTRFLDIRAEAKVHRITAHLNAVQAITYTNADLGAGAYYRFYPFGRRANAIGGFVVEPSVRYWHYVYSTLPDGRVNFTSDDGALHTHTPYNFGLFANVSVGYTFGVRTR